MFSSRNGARTSQTAAGRFTQPYAEKRAASPRRYDQQKRVCNDTAHVEASLGTELFGMSSAELLLDFPVLSDDMFKTTERQSSGERIRVELAQLYDDFTSEKPSATVVEIPPSSPPSSTVAPTVEELIEMSMYKPGYNAVRPCSPLFGEPVTAVTTAVCSAPLGAPAVPTGYVWAPATATGGYSTSAWPQHFAVTGQMVPVEHTHQGLSFSVGAVQQAVSPFVAYSNVPIATTLEQHVAGSVEFMSPPTYTPVSRQRGDGADSFFEEPAMEQIHGNKAVMRMLGSGSDKDVTDLWNLCITSPGTEHSCKQAVDVALHMRCSCHLMVKGLAKNYADVCRQLGMLADRKCLNGCKHKHACQAGTFYCIACVRGEKHKLDVEECLEKWLASGSPIRHGERV